MPRRVVATGRSCLECRRRKIRCDRSSPCGYCVRISVDCAYPRVEAPGGITKQGSGADIGARVERLEGAFRRLIQELPELGPVFQDLLHLDYGDDAQPIQAPEVSNSAISPLPILAQTALPLADASMFTREAPSLTLVSSIAELYPSPAMVAAHWQTFLDAIDPLVKIFHVPSAQRQVLAVIKGRTLELDAATECLMFSIYYSAVVVTPASRCLNEYQCSKDLLLRRYRTGLEYALLKSDYNAGQNVTVLQSMVLYLTCSRVDRGGPDALEFIKVIVGRATDMGLHRRTDDQSLSPFDAEMRCRLWWQICMLDAQIATGHDTDPLVIETECRTPLPANINDCALDPSMRLAPKTAEGKTEMSFPLIQFHITELKRQILFSDRFCQENHYPALTEDQKAQRIDQLRLYIEKEYLTRCDIFVPLDYVIVNYVRIRFPELKLWVYKTASQANKTSPIRINYQKICIDALAWSQTLGEFLACRQFQWLYQTTIEWDALWCLLNDLREFPTGVTARAGWRTAKEAFERWNNDPDVHKDGLWDRIEQLYARAVVVRGGRGGQA